MKSKKKKYLSIARRWRNRADIYGWELMMEDKIHGRNTGRGKYLTKRFFTAYRNCIRNYRKAGL